MGYPFESILVGIGMFTGGTIWLLTHGQIEAGKGFLGFPSVVYIDIMEQVSCPFDRIRRTGRARILSSHGERGANKFVSPEESVVIVLLGLILGSVSRADLPQFLSDVPLRFRHGRWNSLPEFLGFDIFCQSANPK